MIGARGVTLILAASCAIAILVGLSAGPTGLRSPGTVMWDAWHGDDVVAMLRAPRVLLAALVGASLALAGVSMQTMLRNDLAEPYILGLSGGASVGAVASLALWPGLPPGPAAALGAAGASLLVGIVARGSADPARLLLAGVAVGALLGSLTGLLLVLSPQGRLLRSATFWLFGGIGSPRFGALMIPLALLAVAIPWMRLRSERLDRLVLGDSAATSMGVDVGKLRRGVIAISVCLTASAVAAGGLIGFVGLMAPHAARRLVGPGHRALVPAAALAGALLVMSADTVARSAFAPREVPVGLLTAAVGGPFFLTLLGRRVSVP